MSSGILLFQGMRVGILTGDFEIKLNESGEPIDTKLILSTAYNVIPIWLRAARDHLRTAKEASNAIAAKWIENESLHKDLLIAELEPSMQVIVACAICLDALYDQLKPHAKLDPTLLEAWAKNRTSRAAQIAFVIQRIYHLTNDISRNVSQIVETVLRWRDWAVHPSMELRNACSRPDVSVGVDWRFAIYRYENAKNCFTQSVTMLTYLHERKQQIAEVNDEMQRIVEALVELGVLSRIVT